MAKLFIENGANIETTDILGDSPLISAVIFGKDELVKLLIENNANVRFTDSSKQTPLHWAAFLGTISFYSLIKKAVSVLIEIAIEQVETESLNC